MAPIPKLEGQQCPPFTSPFPSPTLLGLGPLSLWCPPPRLELFPQRNATASLPVLDKPTQPHQPLLGVWDAIGALPGPQPTTRPARFQLGVGAADGPWSRHTW